MAVVDFLKRKHDVTIAYFHHGTKHGEEAMSFVAKYCTDNDLPMLLGTIPIEERSKDESEEEYWRNKRYDFLSKCGPVITCHHLDDCVETYVWSSMHGTPKVIPTIRGNVLRPFLTTRKQEFVSWCERNNVPWIEDTSNTNTQYTRNYIRKEMMPHVLRVNPGIHSMVKKIVENKK